MDETQLLNEMLHDRIIAVGVNSQMAALLECPADAEWPDPPFRTICGDTVYNAIRTAVEPRTLSDITVGWLDVLSMGEIKSSDDNTLIIKADITVPVLYIAMDQFLWRLVRRTPLIWITMLCHKPSRKTVNLHNPVEVPLCRMPDCHKMIPDLLVLSVAIRSFIACYRIMATRYPNFVITPSSVFIRTKYLKYLTMIFIEKQKR